MEPTNSVLYLAFKLAQLRLMEHTEVAYAFSAVEGYSAFGSYTGNGSSDGPFVYTRFRVAWLMIKNMSTSGEWLDNL